MIDREITSYDLDILGEIGNIGSGNAATALSTILNQTVNLEVPIVSIANLTDIADKIGGAEVIRTGVFFKVHQELNGYIMFILDTADAERLSKIAAGDYEIDSTSVVSEIANIISGAYIGAIAQMMNCLIDITPPVPAKDMIGALIDSIIAEICQVADKTVLIGTKLLINNETVSGYYVLLLEQESLNRMLDYFNNIK